MINGVRNKTLVYINDTQTHSFIYYICKNRSVGNWLYNSAPTEVSILKMSVKLVFTISFCSKTFNLFSSCYVSFSFFLSFGMAHNSWVQLIFESFKKSFKSPKKVEYFFQLCGGCGTPEGGWAAQGLRVLPRGDDEQDPEPHGGGQPSQKHHRVRGGGGRLQKGNLQIWPLEVCGSAVQFQKLPAHSHSDIFGPGLII